MSAPKAAVLVVVRVQGEASPRFVASSSDAGWLVAADAYVTRNSAWATAIDWRIWEAGWSSRRRDCHLMAPPCTFARCFNRD